MRLIEPIAFYEHKTWTLRPKEKKMLNLLDMTPIRDINGGNLMTKKKQDLK